MDNSLADSILSVCKALDKHAVQYLIVGGTAVALHGYFRMSETHSGLPVEKHDLDFWYNPTYHNYFRLLNALEEFGQDVSEFKEELTPTPRKSFFKFEFENFTLDFLPELKGLKNFRLSYNEREIVRLNEIEILYISFDDLIRDKEINARPKDLNDIAELNLRRKKK